MPIPKSDKIWMDGKFVDWDDAKLHVCSHVVHYGTSVFEGMRCYKTPMGSAAFRLEPHVNRLFNSAKIYRMDPPFSKEELSEAMAFRGSEEAPAMNVVGDPVHCKEIVSRFW